MPHRIKEEERTEKTIRGLLKLQENRRCINCNCLGPQYVCTTFWTFVCTNCSGVHREFTHRVKSVSMAKFNAEEVSSLEAGGNERAREIYFKTWDSQRNTLPDGSNLHRLRDFIKHVYVERRFAGEKSSDKLSMVKMDFRDGFYEKRSSDRYSTGCRDKHYERRPNFDRSTPSEGYMPRNLRNFLDRENGSPGGRSSRPSARFEIVDDRFRDDDYGNVKCYERNRFGDHRGRSLSSDPCRSKEVTKQKREVPDSTCPEKASVSSSPVSTGEKQVEQKAERSSSLIDSECHDASVLSKEQETAPSTNGENSSSLPQTQQTAPEKASPKPPSVNSVEALLLELAAPVDVDASSAAPAAECNSSANDKETAQAFPPSNSNSEDSLVEVHDRRQHVLDTQQDQPSASPVEDSSHTDQKNSLSIEDSSNEYSRSSSAPDLQAQALSNQLSSPSQAPNSQAHESSNQLSSPSSAPTSQAQDSHNQQSPSPDSQQLTSSQPVSTQPIPDSQAPTHSASTEQSSQVTSKQSQEISSARKELPADIFTALYSSYPTQVPFGQYRPPQEMGIGMQYNPSAVIAPGLPITSKSKNPFDFGDDAPVAQNPMFPSSQGAFPHLSAQMGLQVQPSPYAYALALRPHQLPSYGMTLPPGANVGLQPPNSMLQVSRPQENSESNNGEAALASLNPLQYSKPRFQADSYSGGNPFG